MLPARSRKPRRLVGNPTPRLGPPLPARSKHKAIVDRAEELGEPLWPWQTTVSRYITALAPTIGWLYPEVATLAARQNGKTTIMRPLIIERLFEGHRIVHAAQDLKLPREMHEEVATIIDERYREFLPSRRGVKYGVGQESIRLTTGGVYKIVSNSRSGARGPSNDLVLVDEVLELVNMDFVAAALPTTIARPWGQVVYFSNAGTNDSVVLQWLKGRADNDPALAYLEWSAEPGLEPDDMRARLQANPSIGHSPVLLDNLERYYRSHLSGGTLDVFEREHLCRQTLARHQSIVTAAEWATQDFVTEVSPSRPSLGIKMDIGGERASAVLAWQEPDGRIGLDVIADVEGHPIDVDRLGPDLQLAATDSRVGMTVYDPYTDADIARHLRRAKPLTGRDYASASEKFVRLVAGRQLRVRDEAGLLASDLSATIPRSASGGSFFAIKASPETTNTSAEAAIRAACFRPHPDTEGALMSVLSTLGRLLLGDIEPADVETRSAAEVFPSWEQQLASFHNRRAWGPASVDDALTVPSIFRAVTLIAGTVGMLNLETYRDKVLITDPMEVPRITIRPNPRSRPRVFWRDTAFYLATRGEAWWWIARRDVDGNPISLFPVPPWEITVEANPRNRLEPVIRWADRLMDNDDMRQITYVPDRDGLRGVGPLQMCGAAVSISVEAQTWAANFFAGSVPSIVGSTDMDMSVAEAEALDEQWATKASNLPRWLPLGIKIEDFSMDMSKAQAVEQRRFNDGQAAVMFGIPGSLLEYSMPGSSLTYQNVEGEYTKFARTCLTPYYLEPIEQEMSDLLTRTHTSRFNTNEITRADLKSRASVYKDLVEAGVAGPAAAQIVGFETLDPDAINIAPVPASPPGAEITTLPPDIRSSHVSGGVRCQQCNKLLAEFASPPYRMTCSRCKSVTASNGHVPEVGMLEVVRAAVSREQPNYINVNPPAIHFEAGAFRVEATDLSPMTELASAVTELAGRPVPVNEITVQPADVHIDEGAVRVEFTPSPVTVEAAQITVEPPNVTVNVPEQRPMRKQIKRDKQGNIATITEERA